MAQSQRAALAVADLAAADRCAEHGDWGLSPRESQVLELMALGMTNDEIADALVIEPATVKTHVNHVLRKTGARGRVQAVVLAYRSGFVGAGAPVRGSGTRS